MCLLAVRLLHVPSLSCNRDIYMEEYNCGIIYLFHFMQQADKRFAKCGPTAELTWYLKSARWAYSIE